MTRTQRAMSDLIKLAERLSRGFIPGLEDRVIIEVAKEELKHLERERVRRKIARAKIYYGQRVRKCSENEVTL